MMLAMIAVLGPPVARLIAVTQSGEYFIPIQLGVPAAFLAWCMVSDWMKYRIVHPVYVIGGEHSAHQLAGALFLRADAAWESVGRWMAGL